MVLAIERAPVELTRREIAASGIGSDPKAISAFEDLQEFAYRSNPAAAEAAKATAEQAGAAAATADTKADAAQGAADAAAGTASAAATAAVAAQNRADDAYDLAATKADKSTGASWAAPSGTEARTGISAYSAPTISNPPTQAEVQAIADAVQTLSRAVVALITDLRATGAIKP